MYYNNFDPRINLFSDFFSNKHLTLNINLISYKFNNEELYNGKHDTDSGVTAG